MFVALFEVLIVVQPPVVGGDAVEVAHVDGFGALFVGKEGLIHLFAVADADDFDFLFLAAEQYLRSILALDVKFDTLATKSYLVIKRKSRNIFH